MFNQTLNRIAGSRTFFIINIMKAAFFISSRCNQSFEVNSLFCSSSKIVHSNKVLVKCFHVFEYKNKVMSKNYLLLFKFSSYKNLLHVMIFLFYFLPCFLLVRKDTSAIRKEMFTLFVYVVNFTTVFPIFFHCVKNIHVLFLNLDKSLLLTFYKLVVNYSDISKASEVQMSPYIFKIQLNFQLIFLNH